MDKRIEELKLAIGDLNGWIEHMLHEVVYPDRYDYAKKMMAKIFTILDSYDVPTVSVPSCRTVGEKVSVAETVCGSYSLPDYVPSNNGCLLVSSEEVQDAIEDLQQAKGGLTGGYCLYHIGQKTADLAITALRQMKKQSKRGTKGG